MIKRELADLCIDEEEFIACLIDGGGDKIITAECGLILFSATDIYDILQVDRNADDRTVRGAYFRIMKQCHPDKVPREFAELATKAMAKVNDAFESYKTSRRTQ